MLIYIHIKYMYLYIHIYIHTFLVLSSLETLVNALQKTNWQINDIEMNWYNHIKLSYYWSKGNHKNNQTSQKMEANIESDGIWVRSKAFCSCLRNATQDSILHWREDITGGDGENRIAGKGSWGFWKFTRNLWEQKGAEPGGLVLFVHNLPGSNQAWR